MRSGLIVIGTVLLGACAQTPEPAFQRQGLNKAQSASLADAKEKRICRLEEITGSTFKRRLCYTPADFAELQADEARRGERFKRELSGANARRKPGE